MSGRVPPRLGNAHPSIAPYEAFPTADGNIILAVGNDSQFRRFCAIAGIYQYADDPKYATNKARVQNRGELIPQLVEIFRKDSSKNWISKLSAEGIPCGPINELDAVFADAQVKHRSIARSLPHSAAGEVPIVANPIRFSETPAEYRFGPPILGEHTRDVLRTLIALDDKEISDLVMEKVVQAAGE